jgi:hypothetical protein
MIKKLKFFLRFMGAENISIRKRNFSHKGYFMLGEQKYYLSTVDSRINREYDLYIRKTNGEKNEVKGQINTFTFDQFFNSCYADRNFCQKLV